MTGTLQDLLRDEAQRIDVLPAPLGAIVRDGRRRRTVRRTRDAVAVAAAVAVVVGAGVVGAHGLLSDDAGPGPSLPAPVGTPSESPTPVAPRTVAVSGSGVGTQPFGADADQVRTAVTARLGDPDLSVGPERSARVAGSDRWVRDGADPMSPSWRYPVASVSCWGGFCLLFGGDDADSLRFRGWEVSRQSRWTRSGDAATAAQDIDVRLGGSRIGLGDTWADLHAAYPATTVGGGEGASLVVHHTPWPGISDGVGAWRLSGSWDYQRPNHVPADAVITRLSAGEGPEPGCC